jgi:PKD repeat protein
MWDFGDEGSSTEFLPSHTYSGSGPYVLCASVTVPIENALCTAYHCDTLSIDEAGMLQFISGFTIQVVVGNPGNVVEVASSAGEMAPWNLFPNPVVAGTPLHWQATGERGAAPLRLEVIHADGAISHETLGTGSTSGSLSTSGWAAGMHVVRFIQGEQIAIRRIIVQ